MTGQCDYNNIYQVWKFIIDKLNVSLEDRQIRDSSCILITIPHGDF